MAISANPLPSSGVVGRLDAEQEAKLQSFWRALFEIVASAPREDTSNGDAAASTTAADGPPKETAKSDADKERLRVEQETANARLALQNYGQLAFMKSFWSLIAMDDPDSIALRFLRARKWNVNAAVAMLASCIKWRIEQDVDSILHRGEEGMGKTSTGFLLQLEKGKTYTQGFDRSGRPVVYIHAYLHRSSEQPQEAMENFIIYTMETVRCLLIPPADKVTICFNMNGFSMKNMDWNCLMFLVKCLEAYYPESLNCIIVHDAPWVVNGIWKMVSPLLDPVVRAKVQFTKKPAELFVHIPETHVITELGGQTTWQWEYEEPVPGENAHQESPTNESLLKQRQQLIDEYERVTEEWASESLSKDSQLYKTRQCLAKALRVSYFWVDHYQRGKTIYHRNGIAAGNGLVTFEHPAQDGRTEWDMRGHAQSSETLLREITQVQDAILPRTQELLKDFARPQ